MTYEEALKVVRDSEVKLAKSADVVLVDTIKVIEAGIAKLNTASEGLPPNAGSQYRSLFESALSHLTSFNSSLNHISASIKNALESENS